MSSKTRANEDQLKRSLEIQVKHAGMQNLVIEKLSKSVGSAGNLIEKIKKLTKKPDDNTINAINALITKFESKPSGRGARKTTRSG